MRLYLKPSIGMVHLAKLQPEHIACMFRNLAGRGDLSTTTQRYACVVLRIALGRALKSGRVYRNVATLVDMPAKAKVDRHPLTADQVKAFLESARGDRAEALYVLAIATGMRQGELLGLRWRDVALDAGTLSVRHTLQIRTRDLAEPKTANGRRELLLGPEVLSVLREHRHRQLEERFAAGPVWREGDYVFTTSVGTTLDSRNVTRAFQARLSLAGLPTQRFHDLRHATATLLLERGEDLGVISKVLGHGTVSTTIDVYGHLTRGMSQRVAEHMDRIVGRAVAQP